MPVSDNYLLFVLDQLRELGPVESQRMFGGAGLYLDGVFFGLIHDDTLYFKVGDSNRAAYEAQGMRAFRPYPKKPQVKLSFHEVPSEVLENGQALADWARAAVAVAVRARR